MVHRFLGCQLEPGVIDELAAPDILTLQRQDAGRDLNHHRLLGVLSHCPPWPDVAHINPPPTAANRHRASHQRR